MLENGIVKVLGNACEIFSRVLIDIKLSSKLLFEIRSISHCQWVTTILMFACSTSIYTIIKI